MYQDLFTVLSVTPHQWLAYPFQMKDSLVSAYLAGLHLTVMSPQRSAIIQQADRTARAIVYVQPRPAGDLANTLDFGDDGGLTLTVDPNDPFVQAVNGGVYDSNGHFVDASGSTSNETNKPFLDPATANLFSTLIRTGGSTAVSILQGLNETDQKRILANTYENIAKINAQLGRTTDVQQRNTLLQQAQVLQSLSQYQKPGLSTGTIIAIGAGVLLVGGLLIMATGKSSAPPPYYYPPPRRNPKRRRAGGSRSSRR